jgi:hypothetical protein
MQLASVILQEHYLTSLAQYKTPIKSMAQLPSHLPYYYLRASTCVSSCLFPREHHYYNPRSRPVVRDLAQWFGPAAHNQWYSREDLASATEYVKDYGKAHDKTTAMRHRMWPQAGLLGS